MRNVALKKVLNQSEKTLTEVCLSLDGKKIVFLFENGEGFSVARSRLPGDDGSPVTHIEIFDHGCAVAIHQGSGTHYDLPWDSIKYYAKRGRKRVKLFGKRIANLRKKAHLSQAQFAWRTGLSRVQISRLEQNRSEPSVDTLEKISKALGLSIAEFVSD